MEPLLTKQSWQELAENKRQAVRGLIPPKWRLPLPLPSYETQKDVTGPYIHKYLTSREIEITEADAVKIVKQTKSGQWTATEVITAFCHRAALAHQLTNCLHEIFFDQAIANAKLLDEHFAVKKTPAGPLHGLPVSFKDQFHVSGVETTMGYVGWINTFEGVKGTGKEKIMESELVREVRALGAIPFCKTSLPHTVMSFETFNNIVGYTYNPHNRLMSCGGSSGGEGALIAMRGSPIGFGTDIAGSVRIPAAFNGLYAIRPSYGRLPYAGVATSMPGQNLVPSVCGLLASTASALKLMLQATLSQQPWLLDPAVVDLPWREEIATMPPRDGSKLTFGIYADDGVISPLPPIKRAMEEVKSLIHKLGHETINWNPPSHARGLAIAIEAYTSDGGLDIHHHIGLSGEPLHHRVAEYFGYKPSAPKTADVIFKNNTNQRQYQKEYMDYWNSTATLTTSGRPVDAILTPTAPYAAFQLDGLIILGYNPWVNTLDYTAVVIPVSKLDAEVDKIEQDYQPRNEKDKAIWEQYDPHLQHGTPIGLQLVGRRFQEEKMIALAEMFEKAL
ncbi:amidase signature domain-containing protein, partial [Xylogone sp. PMI_703]